MALKLFRHMMLVLLISGCVFDDDDSSSKHGVPATEPPIAPTGLVAESNDFYSVTVRWEDNADNEDGYVLGGVTLPPNTTEWTFTNIEGTEASYDLFAFNEAGYSSAVRTGIIAVLWEYPAYYQVNIINYAVDGNTGSYPHNGFVRVTADSAEVSFRFTVAEQEYIIEINALRSNLSLDFNRDDAWFTHYFDCGGHTCNTASIWASRTDEPPVADR